MREGCVDERSGGKDVWEERRGSGVVVKDGRKKCEVASER